MTAWLSTMVLAQHFYIVCFEKASQSLAPALDWVHSLIGPGGVALSGLSPICTPSFNSAGHSVFFWVKFFWLKYD